MGSLMRGSNVIGLGSNQVAMNVASIPSDRELIAKVISPAQSLNQPETVIAKVLTGRFADGLGVVNNVPDRAPAQQTVKGHAER